MESDIRNSAATLDAISSFWTQFDLEKRRIEYDEIGFKIAEQQEQSVQLRRSLAQSTQQFRKSAATHVVAAVGELLKQYQQEIDRLTQRAKYCERAFLDVYNQLYEAPDPAKGLMMGKELSLRVQELGQIIQRQGQELAEYSAESEEIRNQDSTIRKLEEKIRSLESSLIKEQNKGDEILDEVRSEVLKEMQIREDALQKLLDESNENLETMQKMHQSSQDRIFSMESQNEKLKARYVAELEIASSEIENANRKIAELETEKQAKHKFHSIMDENLEQELQIRNQELQEELSEEQKKLQFLKEELDRTKVAFQDHDNHNKSLIEDLRTELDSKTSLLQSMEHELSQRPTEGDLEDLRTQLVMLQAVQYNTEDDRGGTSSSKDSIETLLVKKNKHLEHQLTSEKLQNAELEEELIQQKRSTVKLRMDLEQSQSLVTKLEADLLMAQENRGIKTVSSASEIEEVFVEDSSQSMVSILRNQRDRLRNRTVELEGKLNKTEKELKRIQLESKTTVADNVALVERLRYLQGYRKDHSNREDVETGLAAEQKYTKAYEERMNPFREFQGRQRERRRRELGFLDRSVFLVGDLVFGNKYARLFVCLYVILLHVLVMTMLWFVSHKQWLPEVSDGGIDSFCGAHGYKKLTN
eukprot:g7495.t1